MKREKRYLVLKFKDVCNYLNDSELKALSDLATKITLCRHGDNRAPLDCVIVESDWPEFEPTWAAIERRVDGY